MKTLLAVMLAFAVVSTPVLAKGGHRVHTYSADARVPYHFHGNGNTYPDFHASSAYTGS